MSYFLFSKVPSDIKKIAICIIIHKVEARHQNFEQVSNAYIRIAKAEDEFDTKGESVLRFDLEEEFSLETALIVAEIYLKNGERKFNAVGAGYQGGLETICRFFGANV